MPDKKVTGQPSSARRSVWEANRDEARGHGSGSLLTPYRGVSPPWRLSCSPPQQPRRTPRTTRSWPGNVAGQHPVTQFR
jgi:hypothetical protein